MPSPATVPLALAVLALALLSACAAPPSPAADAPLSAAEARAELDRLYEGLQEAHYDLYIRRPRAQYDARYRALRDSLNEPTPRAEVRREFQRLVAYGNVAHARIDPPMAQWEAYRAEGGKAFPLDLRVVGGRVFIQGDYSAVDGITVGDELMSVNGVPALVWLDGIRSLVSADNDYLAYTQLESQLPLLVWWQGDSPDTYSLETVAATGTRRSLTVPARSRAEFQAAAAARPAQFELDWNERSTRITPEGIGYLRPGPFYDNRPEAPDPWDPTGFRAFIDEAFSGFIAEGVTAVLIDVRNNPGGDNSFSDPMIAWFADEPFRFTPQFDIRVSPATVASNAKRLEAAAGNPDAMSAKLAEAYAGTPAGSLVSFPIPLVQPREGERFTGPVYLLINRHSYSNTVMVAAVLQDYGFATVLGEETSDLASTYGAAEKFTLPLTGIEVTYPKARILRPNGNAQARGVIPDIAIPEPVAPAAEDTVLAEALRIVASRRREADTP